MLNEIKSDYVWRRCKMQNNRIRKLRIFMVMVLLISVSLLGCGKKTNKNDLTGTTWTVTKAIDEEGMVYTEEDVRSEFGGIDFIFKENGILELSGDGEQYEATWTQDNNEFTYSIYDMETTGTIDNDKITMEIEGVKYELTKKK